MKDFLTFVLCRFILKFNCFICLKGNGAKIHLFEKPLYRVAFSYRHFIFKMKLYEGLCSMKQHSLPGSGIQLLGTNRNVI